MAVVLAYPMPTRTDTADGALERGRWNLPNSNTSPRRPTRTECSAGLRHANAHPHNWPTSATRPLEPPKLRHIASSPNTHWAQCWPTPCQRAPTRHTGLSHTAAGTSQTQTPPFAAQHALSVVLAQAMSTRTHTPDGARELGRWSLPNLNHSSHPPTRTERSAGLRHANAHPHGRRGSATRPLEPPKLKHLPTSPNTHWA